MVYGFVSRLDDETTRTIFRSKKVPMQNIYQTGGLSKLVEVLQSGDVVYVISCNRFTSVNQVYAFAKLCYERGVTLHFLAEPYLDIGKGKVWRPVVMDMIQNMYESECKAKGRMVQNFKMTNEQWDFLFECFERFNLDILSHMFSANGVLKRGS